MVSMYLYYSSYFSGLCSVIFDHQVAKEETTPFLSMRRSIMNIVYDPSADDLNLRSTGQDEIYPKWVKTKELTISQMLFHIQT